MKNGRRDEHEHANKVCSDFERQTKWQSWLFFSIVVILKKKEKKKDRKGVFLMKMKRA